MRTVLALLAVAAALQPGPAVAQSPKAATYITDEEVKKVNSQPGIDRTIRVVDIGGEHLAVGIVHRGPTGGAAGRGAAGATPPSGAASSPAEPCGEQAGTASPAAAPSGITHDSQTESYVLVSGGATLLTR